MFRDNQNRYIFGTEYEDFETYYRQFGNLLDGHNIITIDIVIHDENDIEIRANDTPIDP